MNLNDNKLLSVAIFPYDDKMYPYLKYVSTLDEIHIQILLSPNGWAAERECIYGYKVQTTLSTDD